LPGKVWFVGAGPGAADLLTLRALRVLEQANLVLYDALVGAEVLDHAPQAQKVLVGKRYARESTEQSEIDRLLVARHGNMKSSSGSRGATRRCLGGLMRRLKR